MKETPQTPNKRIGVLKGALAVLALSAVVATGHEIANASDAPKQDSTPTSVGNTPSPDAPKPQETVPGTMLTAKPEPKPAVEAPVTPEAPQYTPKAEPTNPTDTPDFERDLSKDFGNDAVVPHDDDFTRDPNKELGNDTFNPVQ